MCNHCFDDVKLPHQVLMENHLIGSFRNSLEPYKGVRSSIQAELSVAMPAAIAVKVKAKRTAFTLIECVPR